MSDWEEIRRSNVGPIRRLLNDTTDSVFAFGALSTDLFQESTVAIRTDFLVSSSKVQKTLWLSQQIMSIGLFYSILQESKLSKKAFNVTERPQWILPNMKQWPLLEPKAGIFRVGFSSANFHSQLSSFNSGINIFNGESHVRIFSLSWSPSSVYSWICSQQHCTRFVIGQKARNESWRQLANAKGIWWKVNALMMIPAKNI